MKKTSRFEKLECTKDQFEIDKTIQKGNGTSFSEHVKGGRTKLIVYNSVVSSTVSTNKIDLGGMSKLKFTALLGRFNKQLYKRFRTIEDLHSIDIKFDKPSKGKNTALWDTLKPGATFYNIDIRTAYWQIGYKLGYIDHNLYIDLLNDSDAKQGKRYCFSFLQRDNYMIYHTPKGKNIIICDTSILKKALSNVRKQLYREIDNAKKGCKGVIDWNTDGVSVLPSTVDIITKRLKAAELIYKITFCKKIDDYTYSYGSIIKNFKQRPQIKTNTNDEKE